MNYRSGLERNVANTLSNAGASFSYESVKLDYVLRCRYTPVFVLANGVHLETKGYLDEADRRKMRAVKLQYPELDIRFVFMAPDNVLYNGSKTTYAMWAEKHGFPWCSSTNIPKEWLAPQLTTDSSKTLSSD